MARVAMSVSITPKLREFVTREVESGRYQTASEVIRDALFLLKATREERAPQERNGASRGAME